MRNYFCPLCQAGDVGEFFQDKNRRYLSCYVCSLIFVPSEFFLSAEDEKSRYDLHENSPDDPGYRRFLSRLFHAMRGGLKPGSYGLDFGSGPGPTLSVMFEEIGHIMAIYDHFYSRNFSVWDEMYDFITATEVVEHLHDPAKDLKRLWKCLKPGGSLGIMTKLARDCDAFAGWHYKNDLTHVCFFSQRTFEWQADQWQASCSFLGDDVILFMKK